MAPVFVVTPGAWHPAHTADLLVNQLKAAGYEAQAAGLKTVGSELPQSADVDYLRNEVYLPLIDSGKDVVAVLHSYGGFPGSSAIQGLGKKDRQGKPGGILGIIYISAFIPQPGVSLLACLGGKWADWHEVNGDKLTAHDRVAKFYADAPKDLAEELAASLKHHSVPACTDAPGVLAYGESAYDGRRAYIRCEQDQAIPAFVQDMMLNASGCEWQVVKMDTSHTPWAVKPKETAEALIEVAKGWES